MKLLSFLFVLIMSTSTYSQRLFDTNSIGHFSSGFTVGAISSCYIGKGEEQKIIIGAFSGMMVGIAKEIKDNMHSPGAGSFGDIVSTTVGGAVGSILVNTVIRRNSEKRREKKLNKCKM